MQLLYKMPRESAIKSGGCVSISGWVLCIIRGFYLKEELSKVPFTLE